MDPLALRVAARYATRPIPLDKTAIHHLADDLAKKIAAYASRQPPDWPLNDDSNILEWTWTAKTVRGEDLKVSGSIFSQRSTSDRLITGAHVSQPDLLEDGEIHLGIRLNGSLPYKAFTDAESEGGNSLRYLLFNELIHELTHAAEWWFMNKKAPVQESDAKSSPERAREYYNSPHEVRAFMQQIVEEILPIAAGFKRAVKPKTPHEFVMRLLGVSAKWKQIKGYLNSHNEALILKAVYGALKQSGALE